MSALNSSIEYVTTVPNAFSGSLEVSCHTVSLTKRVALVHISVDNVMVLMSCMVR